MKKPTLVLTALGPEIGFLTSEGYAISYPRYADNISFKSYQVWFKLGEIFTRALLLDVHSPKKLVNIYSL